MFSFFKKKEQDSKKETKELRAYISGKVIPIEEVPDEVFSMKTLGGGLAIEPEGDTVSAPCDGVISVVMSDTKHAVGMTLDNKMEILIHEGLDTVEMNGEGFELFVEEGQRVKAGQKLLKFSPELIRKNNHSTVCILVVTNESQFPDIKYITGIHGKRDETVIVEM